MYKEGIGTGKINFQNGASLLGAGTTANEKDCVYASPALRAYTLSCGELHMSASVGRGGYTFSPSDINNAVKAGKEYTDILNRISALEKKVDSIPII